MDAPYALIDAPFFLVGVVDVVLPIQRESRQDFSRAYYAHKCSRLRVPIGTLPAIKMGPRAR